MFRIISIALFSLCVGIFGCVSSGQTQSTPTRTNAENAAVQSTTPTPIPDITPTPLDLNGIDVGTRPADVVGKLGKPLSIKRIGENPCGGRKLTYHYQGLAIDFDPNDEAEKEFMVVGMQVTSPKWTLGPGIKLGISREVLAQRLKGAALNEIKPNVLNYGLPEGSAKFFFTGAKLVKIEWAMNMC